MRIFQKIKNPLKQQIKHLLYQFGWRVIPENKIKYLGFATLDPLGRVFKYESNIYRGIYKGKNECIKEIFNCGLYGELVNKNYIVETCFTNKITKNFPLVLQHKQLVTTLPTEWTFSMFKKAAKLILKINTICEKYGYQLGDAHPYNILFENNQPVWVDIGSIVRKKEDEIWRAKKEFTNFTIAPLIFLSEGKLLEAYSLLQSERFFKIANVDFRETILFEKFLELAELNKNDDIDNLISESWIDKKCVNKDSTKSFWGDYQGVEKELLKNMICSKENRFRRFFKIAQLISKHAKDAETVLDLAGNTGLTSFIIEKETTGIKKLINTDYDYNSIEKSVNFLDSYSQSKVESYLLNFMLPMHERTAENFKSDLVLALAITHHLLLTQGFKLDEILQKISSYSNKYVFIEFMPLGMWGGENKKPITPDWYTIEWFKLKFKEYFKLLHTETVEFHRIENKKEASRIVFIGELK